MKVASIFTKFSMIESIISGFINALLKEIVQLSSLSIVAKKFENQHKEFSVEYRPLAKVCLILISLRSVSEDFITPRLELLKW